MTPPDPLLAVKVSVDYPGKPGVLRDIAFQMERGEIVGLIGKSGSGKSTLALAILRLLGTKGASVRGEIQFQGRNLLALAEPEMRHLRGKEIGLVLQSPLAALNPSLRLGTQLEEAWRAHAAESDDWEKRAAELMASVSLPDDPAFLKRYPRELSVGLAQRVLIAMAIIHRPALLLADEPTSALDVITQSEILELFARLNRELKMGILYISHDLLSIATLCHRVAILHEGEIVEFAATAEVFRNPQHAHTRRLLAALPKSP